MEQASHFRRETLESAKLLHGADNYFATMNKLQARKRKSALRLGDMARIHPEETKARILAALEACGCVARAAIRLRVGSAMLYRLIRKLGLADIAVNSRASFRRRYRLPARLPETSTT